ncbi:MAG TPA: tyrosine-protein phosphatase [Chlamydiales bacterium]|nr:tyrosine-protein phosphatase [Chlamydiales bacterium]
MSPRKIKDHEIVEALKIINASKEPVLVHCWHGADRTGVLISMYRIIFHGWDKESAIREMCNEDFGHHEIYKNLIRYIRKADVENLKQQIYHCDSKSSDI